MSEQLIDVWLGNRLLHVFPVMLEEPDPPIAAFKDEAMERAIHAGLVPYPKLGKLRAELHTCHSGRLEPSDDVIPVHAETRDALQRAVRERAYFLWLDNGKPDGQADACWFRAEKQHLRLRAHALWEWEGHPDGKAMDHWLRARHRQGI